MEIFKTDISVDIHDVDFNGTARTSALMRYMQSAAQMQLTESGNSYDNLKKKERAFILSRIKMEFSESPKAYDKISAETFPATSRGFSFIRCYRLMKSDKIIGRAISAWALVNTRDHSLVKVNDFDLGLKVYDALDMQASRIVIPKPPIEVGKYKVRYSDLDQNFHMNNTRYPDMYSDFLPLENKRISEITISYQNEARAGEYLTVLRSFAEGYHYFRTIREDGKINSECEIRIDDIK